MGRVDRIGSIFKEGSMPANRFTPAILLLVFTFVPTVGCGSRSEVIEKLDPSSAERLANVPRGTNVVISCLMTEPVGELSLEDGSRELVRTTNAVAIEVPKEDLESLKGFGDAERIAVWGSNPNVQRMTPRLQAAILEAWETDPYREISIMLRFSPGTENTRELLENSGVFPRTVAGIVATVSTDATSVFRILQLQELETLELPRQLTPSR
jgi:hypothetical protein